MHRDNLTAALSRAEAEAQRANRAEAELAKLRAHDTNIDKEKNSDKPEPKPISKSELLLYCTVFNLIMTTAGEAVAILLFARPTDPNFLVFPLLFLVGYGVAAFWSWLSGPEEFWPTSYRLVYAVSYAIIFTTVKYVAFLLFK